jgi:hypothetical protein
MRYGNYSDNQDRSVPNERHVSPAASAGPRATAGLVNPEHLPAPQLRVHGDDGLLCQVPRGGTAPATCQPSTKRRSGVVPGKPSNGTTKDIHAAARVSAVLGASAELTGTEIPVLLPPRVESRSTDSNCLLLTSSANGSHPADCLRWCSRVRRRSRDRGAFPRRGRSRIPLAVEQVNTTRAPLANPHEAGVDQRIQVAALVNHRPRR